MNPGGFDQLHIAVESGAGIPAGGFFVILKFHRQIVLARTEILVVEIDIERIVAVGPLADFLSVEDYGGVAHRSVEDEGKGAPGCVGNLEDGAVGAFAYKGEAAGASCFESLLGLAVLLHCHYLEVVVAVKGTVDGPVVGDAHLLPLRGIGGSSFGEFPPLVQGGYGPLRSGGESCRTQGYRKQSA